MRLALVPEVEVNPSQRALYDAFIKRIRTNYGGFKAIREDGALLGPWSVWLQVPKTGEAIRQLMEVVGSMPGLSKVAVQVISLFTAAHFNAAFEIYIHAAIGAHLGLSEVQVVKLTAGEIPADLDAESTIAVQVAGALLKGGVVPAPLFKDAIDRLGLDGFNRVVFHVGLYCLVSMTLNAFDVPADD